MFRAWSVTDANILELAATGFNLLPRDGHTVDERVALRAAPALLQASAVSRTIATGSYGLRASPVAIIVICAAIKWYTSRAKRTVSGRSKPDYYFSLSSLVSESR